MPIEYQGVKVGEVTLVVPNFRRNLVEVTARILQEYAVHAIKTQAQLDRFEAFVQRVQSDDSGQLITELIEVTDWGCSNGNYLEEMDMFIQEVQK